MVPTETNQRFNFWVKYLKFISFFFAIMGVMWAVIGSFDSFGIYDYYFAQSFFGADELPSDVEKSIQFILVPLGATNAAYFILQYFIAKNAFAKRELWAYHAIVFGFTFWFVLDTMMCVYHQVYFNILIANIPCLLVMLPIFFTKNISRNTTWKVVPRSTIFQIINFRYGKSKDGKRLGESYYVK